MMIKTLPLKQWEVGRELRRRIKKRFDGVGIQIPFSQRVLLWEDTPKKSPMDKDP
jgi:small conductance mechanosensitive channel